MSDFMYNFPNQFSLDKWKNIVTPCLRLREIASLTAQLEFLLLMPLRTAAIEGVLVKVTTINALAQNVNRILSVPGGHSFRQCLSTSEKSIIFSNVWINGLTHLYQCFSWARLGLNLGCLNLGCKQWSDLILSVCKGVWREGGEDWWSLPLPSCVFFPPFPPLGSSFSFVDFEVFDLVSWCPFETSWISQFNANFKFLARHLCFDPPNKCRLSGHLCITIYLLQYIIWVPC